MSNSTKKVVILVEKIFEDLEAWYPKIRLTGENIEVVIAGTELKTYQGKNGLQIEPDKKIADINEEDFDGIIIPGGFAPDFLRRDPKVLELVKAFDDNNKLVAFICHAGWVPVSAKVVKGRKGTSLPAIKDDMINAGYIWEDKPVVVDRNFVSSRVPADLEHFCKAILEVLNKQS